MLYFDFMLMINVVPYLNCVHYLSYHVINVFFGGFQTQKMENGSMVDFIFQCVFFVLISKMDKN